MSRAKLGTFPHNQVNEWLRQFQRQGGDEELLQLAAESPRIMAELVDKLDLDQPVRNKKTFRLTVDYDRMEFDDLIKSSGIVVHRSNFHKEDMVLSGKGIERIKVVRSIIGRDDYVCSIDLQKALELLKQKGYRPATLGEIIVLATKYQHPEAAGFYALGSVSNNHIFGLWNDGVREGRRHLREMFVKEDGCFEDTLLQIAGVPIE